MPTLPAPAVWLALLIPLSAACSSSKSDASASASERVRDVNYELFPSTHQLQVQDSAAISELGADGSIVFTTVPDRAIGWPGARLTDDGGLLIVKVGLLSCVLRIDRQTRAGGADMTEPTVRC